ncbi:HNH endonuclease [Priestia megaterium]|uniref:HNH endonuclease n=1 Tax=Priestia megaterium TaxID=1404 RepID=UPI00194FD050|nr:HNH endonuclease [Priestia megaterium]MBM6599555.1 HNH endonuclease [Priestia megaterium]
MIVRKKRLKKAYKKPEPIQVITTNHQRNADIIVEALERARGICEYCHQIAPFLRASGGTPYLEVHHVIPLTKGREDTVLDVIVICADCHRKAHYGMPE